MGYFVSTTIGGCYPNETGAYIANPGYPTDPDPAALVGTLTCGTDQILVTQYRVMGSHGIYVKIGAASPVFHPMYNGFSKVGFYATQAGNTVKVYYVCTNSEENVNGQETITQQTGSGATYGAYLLGTYTDSILQPDWDETPKIDDISPTDPNGGEESDRMPFGPFDQMEIGDLPDPEEVDYGSFVTAFYMGSAGLSALGDALFRTSTWQQLKQNFEGLGNPMDFIISCNELPLSLSGVTAKAFKLGGVAVEDSEGSQLYLPALESRFLRIMCGSVTIKEVWGTAKDYSDISISIFLPYVGMKELDPDLVVGNTCSLQVHVDLWTGNLVYLLHTDNDDIGGKYYRQATVPYRWAGNCASKVPIGKIDNSNAIGGITKTIAATVGGFMVGGVVGAAVGWAGAGLSGLAGGKFNPTYQSSGGVEGSTGLMDYQTPYIIIKRGVPQYPEEWRYQLGAPRFQTYTVNDLSGFTLFDTINLINMEGFSDQEIAELQRELCTEGVIL